MLATSEPNPFASPKRESMCSRALNRQLYVSASEYWRRSVTLIKRCYSTSLCGWSLSIILRVRAPIADIENVIRQEKAEFEI